MSYFNPTPAVVLQATVVCWLWHRETHLIAASPIEACRTVKVTEVTSPTRGTHTAR